MQLECPQCCRVLDFSGERPSFCAYCGKPLPPDLAERTALFVEQGTTTPGPATGVTTPLPECIGGYRLLRRLGRGGMGTVHEAVEEHSGRRVAVKLIAAEFAAASDAVERFRREGQLAAQISHPRCVFVLTADEEAGQPYIAMEL